MTTAPTRPSDHSLATEPAQPLRKTTRDPWFDNAKMLLVTLVVVGHSWELLPKTTLNLALYDFLYLFHVPAFVMVTGYLSRSFTYSRRNMGRLFSTVVVPYVVFEGALAAFRVEVGGEDLNLVFADPHWPMWYLAALCMWRLATPVLKAVPAPLAVAVAISLLGGLAVGDVFDTARTMGLLPFFVIGLLATPEHLQMLRRPRARIAGGIAMATAFGLAFLIDGRMATEWLYWRASYAELDATFLEGTAIRLGLMVAATALALSFIALVPRGKHWFSALGAATLVVYLFHGFPIKAVEYTGFPDWASGHPAVSLVLVSTAALGLAVLLALPTVARRLNIAVDPVGSYRRRRSPHRSPHRSH